MIRGVAELEAIFVIEDNEFAEAPHDHVLLVESTVKIVVLGRHLYTQIIYNSIRYCELALVLNVVLAYQSPHKPK